MRRNLYIHHTGGVTGSLLSRVEHRASEVGSRVAWSGEDWVRFEGSRQAIRVFPGPAWIDIQLVGADEGTIKGLGYRFDVPARLNAPEDAPPEVHFRLAQEDDFTPGVSLLLGEWLGDDRERTDDEEGELPQPLRLLHVQPGGPPER